MSSYPELLARVAADPASDEARLACADALKDIDDARADFIRAQVALAHRMDPGRRFALRQRVQELMNTHGGAWLKPVRDAQARTEGFFRGFIEELTLPEDRLARHGEELFSLEPIHRLRVTVRDGKGFSAALEQPGFAQVRYLHLSGAGAAVALLALAASPHMKRLEGLMLANARDTAVHALVESTTLPSLRSLSFSGSELSDDAAAVLAKGKLPLERLYLSGTGLSDGGVEALAKGKGLASLQILALNRNELSDEGAQALASSKTLAALERLELSRNELSEEGALAFRGARALPKLRRLELRDMGLDRKELEPLRKRLGPGLRL